MFSNRFYFFIPLLFAFVCCNTGEKYLHDQKFQVYNWPAEPDTLLLGIHTAHFFNTPDSAAIAQPFPISFQSLRQMMGENSPYKDRDTVSWKVWAAGRLEIDGHTSAYLVKRSRELESELNLFLRNGKNGKWSEPLLAAYSAGGEGADYSTASWIIRNTKEKTTQLIRHSYARNLVGADAEIHLTDTLECFEFHKEQFLPCACGKQEIWRLKLGIQ